MDDGSAVVVGASGGIGRALADRLDGRFVRLHRVSRSGTGLDLTDDASIVRAASQIAEGPPPRLIVVATGVLHDGHAPERTLRALDADHLMRDYRINAVGPALVAKHLIPLMPRRGRGLFVALSARVGSISDNRLGGWHAYRASKAALNMLLRNLAVETGRTHPQAIVAGLHPGTVATPLSAPFAGSGRAVFTPDQAAERLIAVMDRLTPSDSGGVFAWDGTRVPE